MPPLELAFVLPRDRTPVTGGNLYNAGLVDAVGRRRAVRVVEPERWAADAAAAPPSLFLVDSLCLAALDGFLARPAAHRTAGRPAAHRTAGRPAAHRTAGRPAAHRTAVIAHLLPGLDPGLEPGEGAAAALDREARVLARVDGAVATSAWVAGWLAERGLGGRVAVVPPPPPSLARRTAPPSERPPRLLLVANLSPVKAVAELLVELAARLAPDDAVAIRVVGRLNLDPAYAAACALAAADPRLAGRAVLVGPRSAAELADEYRGAALAVSAARVETYGMALAEARAVGVPIVARRAGNALAHVDEGATGLTVATVAAVAEACVALLRDPAALARLDAGARAAPRDGRHASWDAAADSLLAQLAAIGLDRPDRAAAVPR